jgi:hypothetical protein
MARSTLCPERFLFPNSVPFPWLDSESEPRETLGGSLLAWRFTMPCYAEKVVEFLRSGG